MKQQTMQIEKVESMKNPLEEKKFNIKPFIYVGFGIIILTLIILSIAGLIPIGYSLLISSPFLMTIIVMILITFIKSKELPEAPKAIISSDECESLAILALKTRHFIEPIKIKTTFPKAGDTDTPFSLTVALDALDEKNMQVAVLINRNNGEFNFLANDDYISKRDFAMEIEKTMETSADKRTKFMRRGMMRITPEGTAVTTTEDVPNSQSEQDKKIKEEIEKDKL
jgi:hypothetical protein